ncbi:MAG: M23 family metallopeptidase [Bacteroidota bacterium]
MSETPPETPRRRRFGCLLPFLVLIALVVVVVVAVPQVAQSLRQPAYSVRLAAMTPPDTLPVPVVGVTPGQIADTWGAARSGGRTHEGTDIFADRGTPVVSATEGVVTSLRPNSLGGTVVWVMGPGREMHYYAHLDAHAPDLAEGQRVAVGDTLGTVGTSGNAAGTPPHLHYGIYRTGGAVNPYPRLAP